MSVHVIQRINSSRPVEHAEVVQIIERNRDRVRTTANMILSVSGIALSATVAFILFVYGGNANPKPPKWVASPFVGAIFCTMTAIWSGITSSFLVERHAITTRAAMLHDLLSLLHYELHRTRMAFRFLIAGLILIVIGTLLFVCVT